MAKVMEDLRREIDVKRSFYGLQRLVVQFWIFGLLKTRGKRLYKGFYGDMIMNFSLDRHFQCPLVLFKANIPGPFQLLNVSNPEFIVGITNRCLLR